MAKPKKTKPLHVMSLTDWYNAFDARTKIVGWSLFNADGVITIQRIDFPSRHSGVRLDSDAEAKQLAVLGCMQNDIMCVTALLLETYAVDAVVSIPAALNNNADLLKIVRSMRTPKHCPYCASTGIHLTLIEWEATSASDESNEETLMEHQCRSCSKSFWT